MLAIAAMVTSLVACDDDESTPDGPTVSAPAVTSVQAETSADVTFAVTIPGGFKSYEITATGGTATKKSEPAAGATSGNIVVTYTADASAGAGTVTIVVADSNNKTETETAAINKTEIPVPDFVVVSGTITTNTSWTADNIYELAGRVIVVEGVTLTIEAGTVIKGREGNGSLASALIISRGAKIMAEGTAEAPIIFTSVLDDIMPGEAMGTNLTKEDNEKWGGLIILGKAPISAKNGDTESSIEGLPADEAYGLYGGDVADDNSGILKYVSIRHGGTLIGEGNEINGLTLGGVGSATVLDHIEIFATLDDGLEFFGGTVNASNVLVYWQGDDGLDVDQNYSGTVSNFMIYHGDGVTTDEGFELDGPEGTTYKDGLFHFVDGTVVSDGIAGSAADIKSDAKGTFENVVWTGYTSAKLKFEAEYSAGDCSDHTAKAYTDALQYLLNDVTLITNSKFDAISVYSKADEDGNPLCTDVPAGDTSAASAKATSNAAATGADKSVFAWTAAAQAGLLDLD